MLVKEVIGAVRASSAAKIYVQNIMTQPGETEGYSAVDHVLALAEHCGGYLFPNVLVNSRPPSAEMLKRYEAERAGAVAVDHAALRSLGLNVMEEDLLAEDGVIRHDPDQLARAVFQMALR
jgi:uncharacterized cofD-like protein